MDASVPMTVHQPGDQARRVPADFCGGGDAVKGPSVSECTEDSGKSDQPGDQACRVPTDSIRQGCFRGLGAGSAVLPDGYCDSYSHSSAVVPLT